QPIIYPFPTRRSSDLLQLEGEFRSQILRAQQAARNYVSEPYEYVQDGETFLFTSIISPVIINGRVDGLVGIDIDLMKFDQLLSEDRKSTRLNSSHVKI